MKLLGENIPNKKKFTDAKERKKNQKKQKKHTSFIGPIEIKLCEKGRKNKQDKKIFKFPSLPEQVNIRSNTRYQTYDIINKGSVQIPKGTDADTISWSGIFFGKGIEILKVRNNPNFDQRKFNRGFITPKESEKTLRTWMEKGTVLNLIVSKTSINYDVTISSFERTQVGAFGNIEYSISFTRYRQLKVYDASELKLKPFEVKERPSPPPSETYTVVSGDNLWKISTRFYGAGSRWPEIYEANKGLIEDTANQYRGGRGSDNGHWIYPGEVFTIP